jgi:hypothetical protein
MVTYGTTAIPSDQITVLSGGTVAVSVAFENSVGVVGGMDTANGTATDGEVVTVNSPTDAATKFGDGSELHEAVQLLFQNGAGTVYALPVAESDTTESFSSTSSGVLNNVPAFDPNVQPEHDITAVDGGGTTVDVNIVYDEGSDISTPSASDTINLNPVTGEFEADASDTYDITYSYGDYSTTAMESLLDKSPRIVNVLTENEGVANDLATELNARATNFDFMHGVVGASPEISDVPNYSNGVDERRISIAYPSRGYVDAAETEEVRTTPAIAGELAGLPLGLSATNNSIGGFQGIRGELTGPNEAGTLIDAEVMPLLNYPPLTITKDMTTASEPKFERVYAMQVIDEMTELSHIISRNFVGDQNTEANRSNLRRSHENAYIGARDGTPPLLDDFEVAVSESPSDPNKVNVNIGLDVVNVMDTIDVTITVGEIIRNGGAA